MTNMLISLNVFHFMPIKLSDDIDSLATIVSGYFDKLFIIAKIGNKFWIRNDPLNVSLVPMFSQLSQNFSQF